MAVLASGLTFEPPSLMCPSRTASTVEFQFLRCVLARPFCHRALLSLSARAYESLRTTCICTRSRLIAAPTAARSQMRGARDRALQECALRAAVRCGRRRSGGADPRLYPPLVPVGGEGLAWDQTALSSLWRPAAGLVAPQVLRVGMVDSKSVSMCSFLHCASPIGVVEHSSTQFYTHLYCSYEL